MIVKKHNFHLLRHNPDWYPDEWQVWWNQPNDNHFWAFYYYLKNNEGGNVIYVKGDNERLNLALKKQL